jgi:hypothetical protein
VRNLIKKPAEKQGIKVEKELDKSTSVQRKEKKKSPIQQKASRVTVKSKIEEKSVPSYVSKRTRNMLTSVNKGKKK